VPIATASRLLALCLLCAGLILAVTACGGSASRTHPSAADARAVWATQTSGLCRRKRAAIARLGSVNITYAGIARVGLPAVKRLLDAYLGRLLGQLEYYSGSQRALSTPPSVSHAAAAAAELGDQARAATERLRGAVAGAPSGAALSADFRAWIALLQRITARGDTLAGKLGLSDCLSSSTS
jgi:hypothetical protein